MNGGPAFPVPLNPGEPYQGHSPFDGMTLRDYFAAKAVQAWISTYGVSHPATNSTCDTVAKQAYQVADAMLEARKEGGGE
ncbi:hypothetical protein [Pseudomonas aeruginosa]|nr:hypothetical protein [Pseudomonas aeruginosa]ELK7310603.1 hypothetical protein [Pseudomonas aeruginosa]KSQ07355.2 hypothetical protein APB22_30210 [Pseudomonas aeruginosa]MBF3105467.1 hypothetical protein [Pseudomonas aeruginosa]MDH0375164.1 hypothetical protein [Pseudomonas aeruginosa]OZO25605.1 hypothetical protein CGU43_03945 [Pseudomonas aeruginosa]